MTFLDPRAASSMLGDAAEPYTPAEVEALRANLETLKPSGEDLRFRPAVAALWTACMRLLRTLEITPTEIINLGPDATPETVEGLHRLLPQAPKGQWPAMDTQELRESGLLFWLNRQAFWDLGLALTVTDDENGHYSPWVFIQQIPDWDVIVSGDDPEVDEERLKRAMRWIAQRVTGGPQRAMKEAQPGA